MVSLHCQCRLVEYPGLLDKAMLRLLTKGLALAGLNALLALALLSAHRTTLDYAPWETDSVLLVMPEDEQFDLALLGASHAYLLSRFRKNHEVLEDTLGMRCFNMAMPTGGGIVPARLYLDTFYDRGNTARRVAYFLDPFVFYTVGANDAHKFVYFEPFDFGFLWRLVREGYPPRRILTYVRSKFSYSWLTQRASPLEMHPHALTASDVDPGRIAGRMGTLYVDGLEEANFQRYAGEFERIAERCRREGSAFYVIVPPTLLGPEPGAARVLGWLEEQRGKYGFEVHNLVNAMPQPRFYYNLDHLNTAGVDQFCQVWLEPIFSRPQGRPETARGPGRAGANLDHVP